MKLLSLLLLPLLAVLPYPARADSRESIFYDATAYLDASSGFSKQAKLFIQTDPRCPVAHRDELARVSTLAAKRGFRCVSREDADFEMVVAFAEGPAERPTEGYAAFGLRAYVFRLSDRGTKRGEFSVWEGVVNGQKRPLHENAKRVTPPYVKVDTVVEKLVALIGSETPEPVLPRLVGDSPGILPKGPIENPPKAFVTEMPKFADFNSIARRFFASELIDFGQTSFSPAFVRTLRGETANSLYRKLKLREKEFEGAIRVVPVASGDENVIVVEVRIARKDGSTRELYVRYIHIHISVANMVRSVEQGVCMKQEMADSD